MISIISYVSKDFVMLNTVPNEFASIMAHFIRDKNVLVGSKMLMQDFDGKALASNKTFVLSRKKQFAGTTKIHNPKDFTSGIVLGGRSTIASMMPYTDSIVLGIDNHTTTFGDTFPAMNGFVETNTLPHENFIIKIFEKEK